jgi:hypothetical protein
LLAVRYSLQLGATAERIAGVLADRGVDVSGRTILRWVQKFGPALSKEIRRYRKPVSTAWLVDEIYVKIQGRWPLPVSRDRPRTGRRLQSHDNVGQPVAQDFDLARSERPIRWEPPP